jgi:hypothetical protein
MPRLQLAAFLTATLVTPAARGQDALADLVPADAKFACYFDLQAMLEFVGRDLVRQAVVRKVELPDGARLRSDWNERMAREWGIDPLRDLKGLLLFGDDVQRREPNMVLLTSDRIDGLLEKLQDMGVLEAERGGVQRLAPAALLGQMGVDDAPADFEVYLGVHRLRGERTAQRAIVFGTTPQKLEPALEALRGPKAARRAGALTLATRPGCIAYLEVADVLRELMDRSPASRMANKANHLSMQLSEEGGELTFTAAVQTETEKDARQIAALVNGLKAFLSLVEPGEDVPEGVLDALDRAHATSQDNRVSLRFAVPSDLVDEARRRMRSELGEPAEREDPAPGERTRRIR